MTISIKPTASGSTIEQDGSTILTVDGSGNLTVANNLSVTGTSPIPDALSTASGSAPSYSARAWINFNGQGTISIRNSANISSITDYGTGNYGISFTTAMPDNTYCWTIGSNTQSGVTTGYPTLNTNGSAVPANLSTTGIQINTSESSNGVLRDVAYICLAIFR